jgi:predicted transcriptional regulator
MITETADRVRDSLIASKGEIDHIAEKSGVSRRTLYYVIEGKAMTIDTLGKLESYFGRAIASTNRPAKPAAKRQSVRRARA